MIIQVEFEVYTDIYDAFKEAIDFATKNDVIVRFVYKGITCYGYPNGSYLKGVKEFKEIYPNGVRSAKS